VRDVVDDEVRPLGRRGQHDRLADSAVPPGDDHRLALEQHRRVLSQFRISRDQQSLTVDIRR
jgi:hypothetical protein